MRRDGSLRTRTAVGRAPLVLGVAVLLGALVAEPAPLSADAASAPVLSAKAKGKKCKRIRNKQRRKRCRKKQAQQQAPAAAVQASISITPASHDFGNVPINVSSPSFGFVVTNTGPDKIGFTRESIGGANASAFNVSNSTCLEPLSPGASCTYSVNVRSMTTGPMSGLLTVVATPADPDGLPGSASASLSASLV